MLQLFMLRDLQWPTLVEASNPVHAGMIYIFAGVGWPMFQALPQYVSH